MKLIFEVFGYAILGLGTRLVRDWYAIKVLIINAVTRFRDFLLYLKGWHEKKQKKYIVGEVGNASKWCNRVPKVFVGFLAEGVFGRFLARSFCGVFVKVHFHWFYLCVF
jgi:hypothetical protein